MLRATPFTALALLLAACNGDGGTDTSIVHEDADGDGYTADVDCDDDDAMVFPGAPEVCNGIDDDCNDEIDDDALDQATWYADADGDGHGDPDDSVRACEAPEGYVADDADCNDESDAFFPGAPETDCTDPNDYNCDGSVGFSDGDGDGFPACEDCDDDNDAVNPDAAEVCNGIDDDCDGEADVGAIDAETFFADTDEDGFGDPDAPIEACELPGGAVTDATDCDDTAADVFPGAEERCDDVDSDCDGETRDDDSVDAVDWYVDADTDGFGADVEPVRACDAPGEAFAQTAGDCDDTDIAVNPDADELCDDIDRNCDGDPVADAVDPATFYADADRDGYGSPDETLEACSAPFGWVENADDCADDDDTVSPEADERCDDIDRNCDGDPIAGAVDTTTFYVDADGDAYGSTETTEACALPEGYATAYGDCDDDAADVNPGATEKCDDVDHNCDGDPFAGADDAPTWYRDADHDGYGIEDTTQVACEQPPRFADRIGDCDDSDGAVNPDAEELCDDVDRNCDGDPTAGATDARDWYADLDGDTWGDDDAIVSACDMPDDATDRGGDCDDDDDTVLPGATEVCDGKDNDCDGTVDGPDLWWDEDWPYRLPLTLTGAESPVAGPPISVDVDFRAALDALGDDSAFRPETLRVVLQDCAVGQPELPSQFDDELADLFAKAPTDDTPGDGFGAVTFLFDTDGDYTTLETLPARENARVALYFGSEATASGIGAPSYATDLTVSETGLSTSRSSTTLDPSRGGMVSSLTTPSTGSVLDQAGSCCGNGVIGRTWDLDPQDDIGETTVVTSGPVLGMVRVDGERVDDWGSYRYDTRFFQFAGRPEVYTKLYQVATDDMIVRHPTDAVYGVRPFQALSVAVRGGVVTVDPEDTYLDAVSDDGGFAWSYLQPPAFVTNLTASPADGYIIATGNEIVASDTIPADGDTVPSFEVAGGTEIQQDVLMMLLPHDGGEIAPTLIGLTDGVLAMPGSPEAR